MNLNWLSCYFDNVDGYGRWGVQMLRALAAEGELPMPVAKEVLEWPGWLQRQAGVDFSRPTLTLRSTRDLTAIPGRQWGYSMYESTRPPAAWCELVNAHCERLIVPCQQNADAFRAGGVQKKVPIHIVPGGIDPDEFPVIRRVRGNRPYTFLALADRGNRKGFDLVYRAFWQAFGTRDDVRLIFKTRASGLPNWDSANSDKRVSVWRGDAERMADVYAQADCFVFPSRGEGWGLPPREAAATGMPVIATRWSGLEDGIDQWGIPLDTFTLRPSILEGGGLWAEPDINELTDKMHWCVEHAGEAELVGRKAAAWLRANQTWTHAARQLIDLVREVG